MLVDLPTARRASLALPYSWEQQYLNGTLLCKLVTLFNLLYITLYEQIPAGSNTAFYIEDLACEWRHHCLLDTPATSSTPISIKLTIQYN